MAKVLTATFINALVDALNALARGENIVSGANVRKSTGTWGVMLSADSKGGSGGSVVAEQKPWDIFSLVGQGEPNPETGLYASYKAKVWPGMVNGLIPTNLTGDAGLTEFTISGTEVVIFRACCTTDGRAVTGVEIYAGSDQPLTQEPTVFSLPEEFDAVFAVVIGGVIYRTIPAGNIQATATQVITKDRDGVTLGQLPYELYYIWSIS